MSEAPRERTEILDLAHVFIRDMDSRITFWNTGDARMYGYTAQEAVGRVSHDLLETVFPVPLEDIEAELAKSGEWEGELTQTRRDGQQIVVASYWVLHKDEHGSPASIVEVNNDITESKLAEESLEESNRRLQILSETASQLLTTDDPQGLVQSLCETVMQFLGCHAFFNYLVDEDRDCLHLNAFYGIPDDVAKSIEWLDYGVAVCGCAARDGCRIVAEDIPNTPDPRTELVKSFGIQAYACHPLLSAGGRVIGTLSFGSKTKTCFTDDELDLMKTVADQVATAMERIRLMNELGRRAAEMSTTIDSMADGVSIIAPDGHVVRMNSAARKLLGVGPEGMAGTISDRLREFRVTKPDGSPLAMEESPGQRALKGETIVGFVEVFHSSKGEQWLSVNAAPICSPDGTLLGAVSTFTDVTDRVRAEKELETRALELQEINQDLEATTEELRCETEEHKMSQEALKKSEERFRVLSEVNGFLLSSTAPEALIQMIGEKVMQQLGYDLFFNYVLDEGAGRLRLNASGGVDRRIAKLVERLELGQAICGCVARDGVRIVSEDVQHNGDMRAQLVRSMGVQAYACHPLRVHGKTVGTLSFGTKSRISFTDDELALMRTVADQVSIAMERNRSEGELETQRGLLQAVINNIPDQINLMRGSDLRIVLVNPAYQAIAPGKEMVGKTLDEVWPELDRNFAALCRKVLETREPYHTVDDPVDISRYPGGPMERRYFTWMLLPVDLPGDEGKGVLNMSVETTDRVMAEEALKESEARLRRFYESGMIGVAYYNMEGAITDANDKFLEIVGYTREDLEAGRIDWAKMTPPEYAETDAYAVEELKTRGVETPYEKEYIRKDGSRVPIIIGAATVGRGIYEGVAFVLDITERKKAEQEQERLSRELQLALDAAQLGWWHYDTVTQITTYDERYRQIFGLGGNPLHISDILAHVHPEDLPHIMEAGSAAVDPANPKPYSDEYRIFRGNGSMRWVEVHGMGIFEGKDEDRHAVGFVGTIQDVTDRKHAEEEVRRRAEELEAVMEAAPVAIWIGHDPQARHITGNRVANEFYEAEPGENVSATTVPVRRFFRDGRELPPEELPMQEAAARNIEIRGVELDVLLPSGNWLYMLGSASPLRDEEGKVRGSVGVFMDITERKRAQDAITRAEESKVEFYRKSISAATDGKFEITDRAVIEKLAGPALASWEISEAEDLSTVRHGVAQEAEISGMDRSVAGRFVLAVGEAATNVIKHAGGGTASLHSIDDSLLFMVEDCGPGMTALDLPEVALRTRYSTAGTLGVGYKVMMKVADKVYLATGPEGTVVGVRMSLHPAESPAPAVPVGA